MTLLGDLYAFYLEHQRCGELDADVEGERVWMACTCGAVRRRQPQHDVVLMQRLVQKAKAEAWLGTTSVQVNSSSASG